MVTFFDLLSNVVFKLRGAALGLTCLSLVAFCICLRDVVADRQVKLNASLVDRGKV
jgi:hypothetical protein